MGPPLPGRLRGSKVVCLEDELRHTEVEAEVAPP